MTMTVVTSIEQLEAVPVGGVVSTGVSGARTTWTRNERGFAYQGGATVQPSAFVGDIAARRVHVGATVEPGQVWDDPSGTGWAFVTIAPRDASEGGGWWVGRFNSGNGNFSMLTALNDPSQYTLNPEWPHNTRSIRDMLTVMNSYYQEWQRVLRQHNESTTANRRLRDQVAGAERTQASAVEEALNSGRASLAEALAPLYERLRGNDEEGFGVLRDVMSGASIPLPVETRQLHVVCEGRSAMAAQVQWPDLPEGVEPRGDIPDTRVYVPWKVTLTEGFETQADGGECLCARRPPLRHGIDRNAVYRQLQAQYPTLYSGIYEVAWDFVCDLHFPEVSSGNEEPVEEKPEKEPEPF